MKTLILPSDLPDDIASRQTPSFKKLAEHYTIVITENVKLKAEMERAAIACSHGESKMAQDILLKALGQ